MQRKKIILVVVALLLVLVAVFFSYKSYHKVKAPDTQTTDTSSQTSKPPVNTINLPHADSSLIPILGKVLDDAFDASAKNDYKKLGSLIIYRGPDVKRLGIDVFNAKNNYERNVVRLTSEV
ncbi:MAG TPA: hypothetical protein VG603_03205, partial [Chitinophagales bacterium]|nr:hypothetical protein [Chitinophagales bacterium]